MPNVIYCEGCYFLVLNEKIKSCVCKFRAAKSLSYIPIYILLELNTTLSLKVEIGTNNIFAESMGLTSTGVDTEFDYNCTGPRKLWREEPIFGGPFLDVIDAYGKNPFANRTLLLISSQRVTSASGEKIAQSSTISKTRTLLEIFSIKLKNIVDARRS